MSVSLEAEKKVPSRALLIGVVILALFCIGQIGALYLPAYIGQPPKAFTLFGSILWPGLFCALFFKMKDLFGFLGFVIGAIAGFILYAGAFVLADYRDEVAVASPPSISMLGTDEWRVAGCAQLAVISAPMPS